MTADSTNYFDKSRVNVNLSSGDFRLLKKLAAATDMPLSSLAKRALEDWIHRNYKTMMKTYGDQ
jgi:predicted DNA binding CopG/RHH family protein